ncbi:putative transcription factor MADS27 [Carex littledalei]|uniref:Putative transcription factor MADS27 n=1 Tax=Carex littledalei TaxID=544730 RepID=A0A833RC14_9POAL|nr:putative transcription factor MADS27 [Carex littledalei]
MSSRKRGGALVPAIGGKAAFLGTDRKEPGLEWAEGTSKLEAATAQLAGIQSLTGEDLAGIDAKDLQNLENQLEASLKVIRVKKGTQMHQENMDLHQKLAAMRQENYELFQKVYQLRDAEMRESAKQSNSTTPYSFSIMEEASAPSELEPKEVPLVPGRYQWQEQEKHNTDKQAYKQPQGIAIPT